MLRSSLISPTLTFGGYLDLTLSSPMLKIWHLSFAFFGRVFDFAVVLAVLVTEESQSRQQGFGAGIILIALDDVEYSNALCLNFSNSNNDTKYKALLAGLLIATKMQVKDIHAFVNSKLVASQVQGSYKAKGERMIKYQEKVLELAGAFNRCRITHIPRAEYRKADAISKLAVVQFNHLSKELQVRMPERALY
ncbi:reverse transcriptase domain-containing protein [Tanacetum coccineum]|uniref:Reverse transcriptase domain-containing protein n=1 Tax=Tanacetum coccineum TaxID=301880 RepID=A0ABQ5BNY4_9ASTR